MRPPRYTPNSLNSLQATEYAQEQGKFLEYHHAAYEAYWDRRENLGDPSVLADIGSSVGLDGAELKDRVESGHYAAARRRPVPGSSRVRYSWYPDVRV